MKGSKKLNRFFSLGLAGVVILLSLAIVHEVQAEAPAENYPIDEAWEYPVKPGMDEWENYFEPEQKLKASHVPEDILTNMTTEALVETVLNYPLLIDMYAFDTPVLGYQAVSSIFYGLPELASRPDAVTYLNNYIEKNITEKGDTHITILYANTLIKCINDDIASISKAITSSIARTRAGITYVYTPNNTPVAVYYGLTWADHDTTQAQAEAARDYYLQTYPSTEVVGPVDPEYNCHSYAWYWASTSNPYWMNNPSAYMTDGSYYSSYCFVNAKVFYDSSWGDQYDHSGIVIEEASYPNPCVVKSKWGCCALFTHYVDDCPYANHNPSVRCWWPSQ